MLPRDPASLAFFGASALILLWNVLLAGQIARARRQARDFLAVTALCALLIAPAAGIAVASSTALAGTAMANLGLIWPVVLALFVVQSGIALVRGLISSFLAVPIFALNCILFLVAAVRFATQTVPNLSPAILGVDLAHASTLSFVLGASSLNSPLAIQLPLLAPAFPARWRLSRSLRALLALTASLSVVVIALEYPPAVRSAATFTRLTADPIRARPAGDLRVGLRILPVLRHSPSPGHVTGDLALADTLTAQIVSVTISPSGATGATLDSLESALEGIRADSMSLAVTLGYDESDRAEARTSLDAYGRKRLAALEQIVRRLRPDVLVPALDPDSEGRRIIGPVSDSWWPTYHRDAARLAHSLRPRTRIAVTTSSFTARDSALYAWASRSRDIDLLGFSFAPGMSGGDGMTAQLRVAEHWMRGNRKGHWVFGVSCPPAVFGELNQSRALVGAFAWASRQIEIEAIVVDGAGDYERLVGLRAPGGRWRPAVTSLVRARRTLAESAQR